MIIEAISEVATQMVALTGNIQAEGVGDVCAQAPTGVDAVRQRQFSAGSSTASSPSSSAPASPPRCA